MMQESEIIFLPEVGSTNTWMRERLTEKPADSFSHLFTVCTFRQTAGRGQQGNSWESEPDKNVSFTTLLDTSALCVSELWRVTECCALAVQQALCSFNMPAVIKWPNDIYVGDEKICGILIESVLQGCNVPCCLAGIGINVNQITFVSGAPNPTSMRLIAGHDFNKEEVLRRVLAELSQLWKLVIAQPDMLKRMYMQHLYRREGEYLWRRKEVSTAPMRIDWETDNTEFDKAIFRAAIDDITEEGCLVLRKRDGTTETFHFKQVQYIIPK